VASVPRPPTQATEVPTSRRWLKWPAALLGGAVAIAATAFFGTLVTNLALWILIGRGVPLQEAYSELFYSTEQIVVGQAVGFLCNAAGGYAAASLASTRPVTHGLIAGATSLVFVLVTYATPAASSYPVWMAVWNFIIPLPAAMLGAYVRARHA
jgi:hypothetical protein